jgi:hypothetical protein
MNHFYKFSFFVIICLFWALPVNAEGLAVEITGPANGTSYQTGATVDISVSLSIESGTIKSARLYQNGWQLSSLNINSPNYTWENVPCGNYVLTVQAVDDQDNEVTSDPVTIHVGGVLKYDKALNGEFSFTGSAVPWPWRFDRYEGALATLELENAGLSDDTSSAFITFQDIAGRPEWCVQLMQQFRLQAGHKYEIYFTAWAMAEKPIQVTFSKDYGDYDTHWYTDITLSDELQEYGPYTYESTVDDSLVMMKFILSIGSNDTELYLDAVRILDLHPSTTVDDEIGYPVGQFRLNQNYPNPFNPKTVIRYSLPVTCHMDLSVYNLLGQKVVTLVSGQHTAGTHTVKWDATGFPAGIYFYKLVAENGFTQTKKLVLLK